MPPKKGKKGKKTAAERERAKEMWRRYFEGYDLMMMSYPERLRCVRDSAFGHIVTLTLTDPLTRWIEDNHRQRGHPSIPPFRSFTDWPFTEAEGATCTAERMAAAGFYLAPTDDEPDLARCFFCRRELDGWEPEDDPMSEHRRRDCPFVTLGKQQGEMEQAETVTLMVDRAKALLVSNVCYDHDTFRCQSVTFTFLVLTGKTDGRLPT